MCIVMGEETDELPNDGKDPAAKALGKKGGLARAKIMTPGGVRRLRRKPLRGAEQNSTRPPGSQCQARSEPVPRWAALQVPLADFRGVSASSS
jgi:hypothetical protein